MNDCTTEEFSPRESTLAFIREFARSYVPPKTMGKAEPTNFKEQAQALC